MVKTSPLLRSAALCFVLFFASLIPTARSLASATTAAPASACAAPEYHQFDFWLGDWDAYDVGTPDKIVARNKVDRLLDGCVLREDYHGTNGGAGQSFRHLRRH
jgi:hypothetical protein